MNIEHYAGRICTLSLSLVLTVEASAAAQTSKPAYPNRAPISEYSMSPDAEVALARSAAPSSLSEKADVMVLSDHGYRTQIKGTNGFVCMVWRSWSTDVSDGEFWNPKVRSPICLNPTAVRSVLPGYIQRTNWVLDGISLEGLEARYKAAAPRDKLPVPEPGAMSYMMSRDGYLADDVGHAMPHIMFFVPRADRQDWGANLPGSPVAHAASPSDPIELFFITVPKWSDGTPAVKH
jgi:hypothetical protein